jgi:hypothetical protein
MNHEPQISGRCILRRIASSVGLLHFQLEACKLLNYPSTKIVFLCWVGVEMGKLIWFVVDLPLWKIWVRQLGWWHSIPHIWKITWKVIIQPCSDVPVTNQWIGHCRHMILWSHLDSPLLNGIPTWIEVTISQVVTRVPFLRTSCRTVSPRKHWS